MTPGLRIKALPARGIRRCGVRHPAEWVKHPPGTFTSDQIIALCEDLDLQVELLEDPADVAEAVACAPVSAEALVNLRHTLLDLRDQHLPAGEGQTHTPESVTSAGIEAGTGAAASTPAAPVNGGASQTTTDVAPVAEQGAATERAAGEAGADGAPASSPTAPAEAPAAPAGRARKPKES